ncbi:MAG: hypothetical protein FD127_92 [Acidimicrobiaceae bacterium]|nr:MAG: hypothetical protein FD127_92 [Acidimicrobiaceae bacterium]
MSVYFEFDEVDAFTIGAVGRPGQRTFLIQARRGGERVTVKCEKQQAAAIAEYLTKVLHDLPPPDDRPMPGALELAVPLDVAFVLGPVGLGYDRTTEMVLLQLDEFVPVDDEGEPEPDALDDRSRLRVFLTRGQVVGLCEQIQQLLAAGRPNCMWCTLPIDPDGHVCPRMN